MNRSIITLWIASLLVFNAVHSWGEDIESQQKPAENRSYAQQARDFIERQRQKVSDFFTRKSTPILEKEQQPLLGENYKHASDGTDNGLFYSPPMLPDSPLLKKTQPLLGENYNDMSDGTDNGSSYSPPMLKSLLEEELGTGQLNRELSNGAISGGLRYEKPTTKLLQDPNYIKTIKNYINDPNVTIDVLKSMLKEDFPSSIKEEIRTQLRLRGAGRFHDFSGAGLRHALKSDVEILSKYLRNEETGEAGLDRNKIQETIVKDAIKRLNPQDRTKLFNKILQDQLSLPGSKPLTPAAQSDLAEQLITPLLPDNNLLFIDQSGKTPKLIDIDLNDWNSQQTVKANIERIKIEQGINISSKELEEFIKTQTENKPDFRSKFAKSQKLEQDLRQKRGAEKDIKTSLTTYLIKDDIDTSEQASLKLALSKLSTKQRAELFTKITQSVADLNRTNTVGVFDAYHAKLRKLLPDTDLLLVVHDKEGKLVSYKFKIADMSKFKYDAKQSYEENAARLIKEQDLNINRDSLVPMLKRYWEKYPKTL